MVPLLFVTICLIWGSTWLGIKLGLAGVPPFLGAGLRFLLATLVSGALLVAMRRPIRLTKDDKICIWSLGLLAFWLNYAAVYWAELRISSGLAAVLFSTMPLMTALLSRFWARSETLGARKIGGILVGVVGTAILFWPDERLGAGQVLGMLATLGACVCASINLVTMKRRGRHADPFVLNFFGMGIGTTCLLATSAVFERGATVVWTRTNVAALLYLAVFGSVVAFSAYYTLIKRIDATIVSLSTLVIPIVALGLGWAVLGERLTSTAVAGIPAVLLGVAIAMAPGPSSIRRRLDGRP